MKKIKNKKIICIALSGDQGRVGKSLKRLIKKSSHMKLTARANKKTSSSEWKAQDIDGVVDFSSASLFSKTLKWAVQNKKAFVSGTTGLSPKQKQDLKKASKKIPIFYGENMSGGVFLFSKWLKDLFNTDVQVLIEDTHHKNKKDRPSGTALRLKNSFPKFLQKKIKIISFRKGHSFGTHRLTIKSSEEVLILEHRALNRELFSVGALQALLFILKKKKGYYDPSDLYNKGKLPPLP